MELHQVSLTEFLRITKFTKNELLELLSRGELDYVSGQHGELLINVTHIDPKELARTVLCSRPEQISSEVQLEQIASSLISSLESIVEEALEMALRWLSSEQSLNGKQG